VKPERSAGTPLVSPLTDALFHATSEDLNSPPDFSSENFSSEDAFLRPGSPLRADDQTLLFFVPKFIRRKVAGIAMGLILGDESKGEAPVILTDILGSEDALGDMDFKVAGDGDGISAFQMDIKVEGITLPVLREALESARTGLVHILGEMDKADPPPAGQMSVYAPQVEVIEVPTKYIGKVIGKGGEQIKSIVEETKIDTIDIKDDGVVTLTGAFGCDMARAVEIIKNLTIEPEVG
jgi:polyribonucleotide nucleotidyltransferase